MKVNDCKTFSRQIDELKVDEQPNAQIQAHLQDCAGCRSFHDDRLKLRQMIAGLEPVTAPGDFDFRLRARLAQERDRSVSPFSLAGFGFGLPSMALAIIAVVVGVGLYVRTASNPPAQQVEVSNSTLAEKPSAVASVNNPDVKNSMAGTVAEIKSPSGIAPITPAALDVKERGSSRRVNRNVNNAIRRDQFFARSEGAQSLGAAEPLRVSVDYATGGSRTISLPAVSFGSQQVVASGASMVKTSARTVW
jgi:hypothetical protein